jgi:hypothetical protein
MKIWDKNRTLSEREMKQAEFSGKILKKQTLIIPACSKCRSLS